MKLRSAWKLLRESISIWNEAKAQTFDVTWPEDGGKVELKKYNYDDLNGLFVSIMQSKAKLVAQRCDVDQPAKDAQDKLARRVKPTLSTILLEIN